MTVHTLQQNSLEYIEDVASPAGDGWQRQVTVRWQGHKLRARVRRDFYIGQCRFVAEVWSPATLSWNQVQALPPQAVIKDDTGKTWKRSLDYFEDPSTDPYALTQDVVDELLAYAQQVVA